MQKKTVDMLTKDSVSIETTQTAVIDGTEYTLGVPHRCAYVNSVQGRALLAEQEPEDVVAAVLAMWGDTPTIVEDERSMEEDGGQN